MLVLCIFTRTARCIGVCIPALLHPQFRPWTLSGLRVRTRNSLQRYLSYFKSFGQDVFARLSSSLSRLLFSLTTGVLSRALQHLPSWTPSLGKSLRAPLN